MKTLNRISGVGSLVDRGRQADHYFGCVGIEAEGALREVAGTEIALDATGPGSDESEIEYAADYGTGHRNEAANPFFGSFLAEFDGEAFGDARSKLFDYLFFREVLAQVDAGGGRRREPKFALIFGSIGFETIEQAETLNQAKGDDGQQSRIGDQGDHAAEAEARALSKSEALGVANHNFGDSVEAFDGNQMHVAKIRNVKPVLASQVVAEIVGIDFDGAESLEKSETQKAPEGRAGSGM